MKKFGRWLLFGMFAIGLMVLLFVVGINKNLRAQLEALLLEKFVKNKVGDLKEKAARAQTKAEAGVISAEEAEKIAKSTEEEILKQKEDLQKKYEEQGMAADDISNRINNLRV